MVLVLSIGRGHFTAQIINYYYQQDFLCFLSSFVGLFSHYNHIETKHSLKILCTINSSHQRQTMEPANSKQENLFVATKPPEPESSKDEEDLSSNSSVNSDYTGHEHLAYE